MSEHSNTYISPPLDWQAFERLTRLLFQHILKDPSTSNNGRSGQVQVWGWGRLQQEINNYYEVRKAFDPDSTLVSDKLLENNARLEATSKQGHATTHAMIEKLLQAHEASSRSVGLDNDSASNDGVNKVVHAQIDKARDLLRSGQSASALTLLETYRTTVWDAADNKAKFRITTNIASALSDLGRESDAAPLFEEAATYEPEHPLAEANLALSLLMQKKYSEAFEKAQSILAVNPSNADAASYLIQACIPDEEISEPLNHIPAALHKSEAVVSGLIQFYRARRFTSFISNCWVSVSLEAVPTFLDLGNFNSMFLTSLATSDETCSEAS